MEIMVVYYDLFDIHGKFEFNCDVTKNLIPTPSWLVYFVLKAQPFFINFHYTVALFKMPIFPIHSNLYIDAWTTFS